MGNPRLPKYFKLLISTLTSYFSTTGLLKPASGGTGVNNGTNNLTVPATGTAALLGTENTFTAAQVVQKTSTGAQQWQLDDTTPVVVIDTTNKRQQVSAGWLEWTTTGLTSAARGILLGTGGGVNGLMLASDYQIKWSANAAGAADAAGSNDTGFARHAAGVAKLTDASTGIKALFGGGATVASDTALPLPTGRVFHVSGTNNITSITSTNFASGAVITLIFDGVLTFTDGNNLKLAGNFVTTADDTITLAYDGSNWYECCRSVN